MPTSLTGSTVASTYDQLLHVDGGPDAALKVVYSGDGVATGLRIGTGSAGVGNIKLESNTISTTNTNGNLSLSPNGSGAVAISKVAITGGSITGITDLALADGGTGASNAAGARTNLGLGTIATQAANSVAITGGAINGVAIGNTTAATILNVDNIRIDANAITSTNTNGNISITPNGSGVVNISNVAITAGTVPFNTITNRAYASFYDAGTTDQVGSTTDRTAVKWATAAVAGAGITIASNSRITLAAAGTYRINASLQFNNSTSNDHDVVIWFAKNGTNIANTGAKTVIPKTGDGGTMLVAYEIFDVVAANDYIEVYWYPENVAVTLHYVAAVAEVPGVTPAIPATPPAIVVVERIA